MHLRIILMIIFRIIERLQRHHLRHDRPPKHFRLVKLRNVSLGNVLLLVIAVEDHRRTACPYPAPDGSAPSWPSPPPRKTRTATLHKSPHLRQMVKQFFTDSACPVLPLLTVSYIRILHRPARVSRGSAVHTFHMLKHPPGFPRSIPQPPRPSLLPPRSLNLIHHRTRHRRARSAPRAASRRPPPAPSNIIATLRTEILDIPTLPAANGRCRHPIRVTSRKEVSDVFHTKVWASNG